jgi:2'-5' RNA ligase
MTANGQTPEMLRLFVAIVPDPTSLAAMHRIIDDGGVRPGPLRWVTPANTHLTLRFLGDTPAECCPNLIEALRDLCRSVPPFDLRLGGLLYLPSPARTRVVAAGVQCSKPLDRLAFSIETAVTRLGFKPEPRPFLGHITVARCRNLDLRKRRPLLRFDDLTLPVLSVDLIQSTLTPAGALYTSLARLPLGSD